MDDMWSEDDIGDYVLEEEVASEYTDLDSSAVADPSELLAALEAVKGQLEVEQRRREDLESQLEDVVYEADRTKEELEEARRGMYAENIAADVAEVAAMKAEINELHQTVAGLKDECVNAASSSQAASKNNAKATLRGRVDALELQQVKTECANWKNRFETLQERYQSVVDIIKDLKAERASAQRELQTSVSNRRREVSSLKSKLAQQQAQLQACRIRLRDFLVASQAEEAAKKGREAANNGDSRPPRMIRRVNTTSSVARPKTAPSPFRVRLTTGNGALPKNSLQKKRSWRDPRPNDKPLASPAAKDEQPERGIFLGESDRNRTTSFSNLLNTLWHKRDDSKADWDECNVSFEQLNDSSGRPEPKNFCGPRNGNNNNSEEKYLVI